MPKWVAARLAEVEATIRGAVEVIDKGRERVKAASALVVRRRADTERFEKELKEADSLAQRITAKAALQKTLDAIAAIKDLTPKIGTQTRESKAVEAVRQPGVAGVIKRAGLTAEGAASAHASSGPQSSGAPGFGHVDRCMAGSCAVCPTRGP